MTRSRLAPVLACLATVLFAGALLRHLQFPLLWADEAETAMFARRVAENGYPKVHDGRNVVYQFGPNIAVGVKEASDAYIGTTWGHIYFALPGLLWARASDDLYVKTWRLRLPFALAGAVGVGLWLWALLPAVRGPRERRWHFAASYLLLATLSVSLLLHLREVRYYALVVLLAGALAREHLGYSVYASLSFRRWSLTLPLLLLLLFNTFFQAFFAFTALLGAERLVAVARGRAGGRDLLPFVATALLVAPLLVYYETFQTARAFAESFSFGPGDFLRNLASVSVHLLRYEFLLPALLCRALVLALSLGGGPSPRVAARLLAFAGGYVVVGCLNPLPLERYFVVLSPLLSGAFLLDAFALTGWWASRADPQRRRRAAALAGAAIALVTALVRLPAVEELGGRLRELATPNLGPLDFAIPFLRERYAEPEALVIATNYEEYAFMYYLDSQVIIGLALNNLSRDQRMQPDVVLPRRRWPRSLDALRPLLAGGDWEEARLPVRDTHHNNVPALSRTPFMPDPHRFATPATEDPDQQLLLYLRVDGEPDDAHQP